MKFSGILVGFLSLLEATQAIGPNFNIRQHNKELRQKSNADALARRDVDPATLYPPYTLAVPVDHFHNDSSYEPHSNGTFNLRYWFDASNYKKGGPVIVLAAGETSGVGRLVFLQKGIVSQLTKATGGVGVILEHRYYGSSNVTQDLSTQNLRFLTTDQALADTAYFAKNVKFPGLDDLDLTAPSTPWIVYGGSYAGAFAAFLRKLYPDVFWGAISSSGVTEAIYDYWEYYEAQRLFAQQDCVVNTQKFTNIVDNIIIGKNGTEYVQRLKDVFGLGNVTFSDDFADTLAGGIVQWQGRNWDPKKTDYDFDWYCGNITADTVIYSGTEDLKTEVQDLLAVAGYGDEDEALITGFLNYVGYVNLTELSWCDSADQDKCYAARGNAAYSQDDISQDWRLWPYQVCSQWGYLQTGSGVPKDQLPLISRTINLDYISIICREAFNISSPPDIESINKYGGFGISYPRLAIVDGEADPWRAATPHALSQPNRTSTISEPFILIEGEAVHHWDENGLFPNETTQELPPAPVVEAQRAEAEFVQAWVKEFQGQYPTTDEL